MNEAPRQSDYAIDPIFLDRWSPRAFTAEEIAAADLLTMIEAARWAPSSFNAQPWRFVYARRDTPAWGKLLDLLVPFNQSWAKDASALVFFVSKITSRAPGSEEDAPSYTHSFDTGAASANFALQANKLGWFVHGMSGFDVDRAYRELGIPEGYRVEAAYAVGRRAGKEKLPDFLQKREMPSGRMPLVQLAFEGRFDG